MRVLLDSNVVLDMLLDRMPFANDAARIFELAARQYIGGYLSASNLTDIFYLAKKVLSESKTRTGIRNLLELFQILSVGDTDCKNALMSSNPDFEDALLESCARAGGMDYIVTRDKNFLACCELTISPGEFLKRMPEK